MHCRHLRAWTLPQSDWCAAAFLQTGQEKTLLPNSNTHGEDWVLPLPTTPGPCFTLMRQHSCANSTARETKETTDKLVAKDRLAARHKMMIEGQLDIRAVHAKVWLGRNYWSFRRKRFPTFAHFCNVGHIQLRSA